MRGRRMGSAKHAKKNGSGAATVILLLLLAAAFIYAFQALGIAGMIFKQEATGTPTPPASPSESAVPGSASPQASATAGAGAKVSGEIKLSSVTLYGVQLGVFTKQENAQAAADQFKSEGSAGYILKEDSLYRVIDSVYYSESDADTVRDAFRSSGSSPDACVIRVSVEGVNWNVNATQAQIDAIRGALSAIQSQIVVLINAQKMTQQNQGSADNWKMTVSGAAQIFTSASGKMMLAVGQTNSDVILKLNDCMAESSDSLTKLSNMDSSSVLQIESGLKYDIIDMLLNLQNKVMG